MDKNPYYLEIGQIKKFLPHRYPILLVDRVLEIHPTGNIDDVFACDKVGTRVVAIKCVSYNEPFFEGHYANYHLMPGGLITEMIAQVAAFSLYPAINKNAGKGFQYKYPVAAGYNYVRFRKPITPGDVLRIETVVISCRHKLWVFKGEVTVNGVLVAEAEIMGTGVEGTGPTREEDSPV